MARNTIPIIPFRDVLLVAIQIELSDSVALALKDDVTRAIERHAARGLIIDLTGVDLLDSYISRVIRDLALMARLMGVSTVLSGMQAAVAMTMVEMGMDWKDIPTAMDLGSALDFLEAQRAADVAAGAMVVDDVDEDDDGIIAG